MHFLHSNDRLTYFKKLDITPGPAIIEGVLAGPVSFLAWG